MLLNQAQYKELIKILNGLADEIQDLINNTKDDWDKKDEEDRDSLQRGIYMGKLGALNTCLQLFRNKADSSYKMEMNAADVKILHNIESMEQQIIALNKIAEETSDQNTKTLVLDQIALFEYLIKDIKLLLRQVGTKNA